MNIMTSWHSKTTPVWAFSLAIVFINSFLVQAARLTKMSGSYIPCKTTAECPVGLWCLPNPVSDDGSLFCDCNTGYGYSRKLPTPNTPLYTLNPNDYCEVSGTNRFLIIMLAFLGYHTYSRVLFAIIHLIRCMKKAKTWVNNVATRTLIFLLIDSTASFVYINCVLFGTTKTGPSLFLFGTVYPVVLALSSLSHKLSTWELVVAWIDLVQKTATLSRTTAPTLTAAKYFLRAVLLVYCVFTLYTFIVTNVDLFFVVNVLLDIAYLIIFNISGRSLRRLLLPDPDDKSHANYPAAESIRSYYVNMTKAFVHNILWYLAWPIFLPQNATIGVAMIFVNFGWPPASNITIEVMLEYIKVRKFSIQKGRGFSP
jgi:hypothetical protein